MTIILLSFWATILLCVPYWWVSTSIERLPLSQLPPSTTPAFKEHVQIHTDHPPTDHFLATLRQELALLGRGPHGDPISVSFYEPSQPLSTDHHLSLPLPPPTPSALARTLVGLLPSTESILHTISEQGHKVIPYAPRLRLSFTLLLEDVAEGGIMDWEIETGLNQIFRPFLASLTPLHNVTLRSQIQYHSPISVTPFPRSSSSDEWVIRPDDAKAFVNSEKWSVDTGDQEEDQAEGEPVGVVKLMLFVPKAGRRNLGFEVDGSAYLHPTILLPQQGSLTILPSLPHDPAILPSSVLRPILEIQLETFQTLLGVPSPSSDSLTSFQLSTMLRRRAVENVQAAVDGLSGLDRLVVKIGEMRIGRKVQADVQGAVEELEKISQPQTPREIFEHAKRASRLSSQAFFNPTMLGLLYFPNEHKYAVYAPLFAPVGVPLVVGLLKELKRRRLSRKAKAEEENQQTKKD